MRVSTALSISSILSLPSPICDNRRESAVNSNLLFSALCSIRASLFAGLSIRALRLVLRTFCRVKNITGSELSAIIGVNLRLIYLFRTWLPLWFDHAHHPEFIEGRLCPSISLGVLRFSKDARYLFFQIARSVSLLWRSSNKRRLVPNRSFDGLIELKTRIHRPDPHDVFFFKSQDRFRFDGGQATNVDLSPIDHLMV